MRLSTEPADPGYSHIAHLARIWLAGVERNDWRTADEGKRWAKLKTLDKDGRAVLIDGKPHTEEFWGDVRIEPAQVVGECWC